MRVYIVFMPSAKREGEEMRKAWTRAVARAAAVERSPRGWRALLSTVRGGCASSPALGDAPLRVSIVQRARGGAADASLGSMTVGLYAHRCVLGVSPPRCSRVSLASFSSRGGDGVDHVKPKREIPASTTLREVLIKVRGTHSDFTPRDAATTCHRLANKYGQLVQSEQDEATFQLAIQAAIRTASGMNSLQVSNTMRAFATLADKGREVEVTAVRAVSEQAPRVAGEMNHQDVSNTLRGIAKLAVLSAT
jgi:hypothetical protein